MPPDLEALLAALPLGPIEYFDSVRSTNDVAAERLASGAPDLSLIVANEQTAGRGRRGRRWHTPPESALAFSLLLRPPPEPPPIWSYAPLGALAVQDALAGGMHLPATIKWPNDVLISDRKVCGVLAEAHWQGHRLKGLVLGIGVNVLPAAVPPHKLPFPAGSVAQALGEPVDRWALLALILTRLLAWRTKIGEPGFVDAWEERLAFLGQQVLLGEQPGKLLGLTADGRLRLLTPDGPLRFPTGELSLRPVDSP